MGAALGHKTKIRRAMPIGERMGLEDIARISRLEIPAARRSLNKMAEKDEVLTVRAGNRVASYTRVRVTINPPHIHLNASAVPDAQPAYTFDALPSWMQSFPVPHQVSGRVHSLSWED